MAEIKQRKQPHNVSIKEVIGSLCRLLTTLGLQSVPNAESFRRAKFNKGEEVVEEFWKLLISIISATNRQKKTDVGSRNMLVRETLWLSGCGADIEEAHTERKEVMRETGSRQLLLALGWLISSDLLEQLLGQKAAELDTTLTLSPVLTLSPELVPSKGEGLHSDPALLRKLQWLIGCLKFQGRTLLSLQEERVQLLHQILSWTSLSPQSCFPSSSSFEGSSALKKECVQMQRLCELLEAYLNWKHMEKLFWVWMDSVLDCQLADESEKGPVALVPTQTTSRRQDGYLHGDPADLDLLDIMVKRLPVPQSTEKGEVMRREKVLLIEERKIKEKDVEGNICIRLQGLTMASALPPISYGYRAKFKRQRPHQQTNCPTSGVCVLPGEVQCSNASNLLKERELWLLHEQTLSRLANKNALQDLTGRQSGLVLIPP